MAETTEETEEKKLLEIEEEEESNEEDELMKAIKGIDIEETEEEEYEEEQEEEEEKEVKKEKKAKLPIESVKSGATMAVTAYDILISILLSVFSGRDSERYSMTKTQKRNLEKATFEYFKTLNITVNPLYSLLIVAAVTTGASVKTCIDDVRENKKKKNVPRGTYGNEEKTQENVQKQPKTEIQDLVQTETGSYAPIMQVYSSPQKQSNPLDLLENSLIAEMKNKRGRFQFYKLGKYRGFYEFDPNGKRYALEKGEHLKCFNNKPSSEILNAFSYLVNEQGKDEKEAYKEIGKIIKRNKV